MKEIIRAGLAELGLLDQVPQEAPEQLAEYGRLMLEKKPGDEPDRHHRPGAGGPPPHAGLCPPCSCAPIFRARKPSSTWAPGRACPDCP